MTSRSYWTLLFEFLIDEDSYIRKWGMVVLKQNLSSLGVPDPALWQTFFDLYETLEGYVSHLIKVIL